MPVNSPGGSTCKWTWALWTNYLDLSLVAIGTAMISVYFIQLEIEHSGEERYRSGRLLSPTLIEKGRLVSEWVSEWVIQLCDVLLRLQLVGGYCTTTYRLVYHAMCLFTPSSRRVLIPAYLQTAGSGWVGRYGLCEQHIWFCPWVRHAKCIDLLLIKSKMFFHGPSITLLHVECWTIKVQVKHWKCQQWFSAVSLPHMVRFSSRTGYNVAVPGAGILAECRFSCLVTFSLKQISSTLSLCSAPAARYSEVIMIHLHVSVSMLTG